ncbi:hypothetical protein [Thiocapsa roseopersicina]|jgi:NhaP-type Na+/H+ and K+/H+ antiporter|uniref:Uncharacterized protein n=1 Tax=Thiocapsa roseopersicina TaxID=1058 RepID=A0A1H3BLP8_THIRO|nr:hypothetical protein [Thiocapsa roseopersicina]NCC23310.1 hypothetical protein [Alphaproteobacteria bacterium]SDX42705.1 hypothetical protein SAMN05421783_12556 [Thiocapsa roseopersicina]
MLQVIAQAELIFHGWTIPRLARRLRLKVPAKPGPDECLELTPAPADGHAISGTRALGRRASDLRNSTDARAVAVLGDDRMLTA